MYFSLQTYSLIQSKTTKYVWLVGNCCNLHYDSYISIPSRHVWVTCCNADVWVRQLPLMLTNIITLVWQGIIRSEAKWMETSKMCTSGKRFCTRKWENQEWGGLDIAYIGFNGSRRPTLWGRTSSRLSLGRWVGLIESGNGKKWLQNIRRSIDKYARAWREMRKQYSNDR